MPQDQVSLAYNMRTSSNESRCRRRGREGENQRMHDAFIRFDRSHIVFPSASSIHASTRHEGSFSASLTCKNPATIAPNSPSAISLHQPSTRSIPTYLDRAIQVQAQPSQATARLPCLDSKQHQFSPVPDVTHRLALGMTRQPHMHDSPQALVPSLSPQHDQAEA